MLSDAPDSAPTCGHADHHLALRRIAVGLDDDVLAAAGNVWSSALRDLLHGDRLVELLDDDRAAGELDALRNALGHDRRRRRR